MAIKYTKNVHRKTHQISPKFGTFGLKTNHLATLGEGIFFPYRQTCQYVQWLFACQEDVSAGRPFSILLLSQANRLGCQSG
jgi:hypothetical protein